MDSLVGDWNIHTGNIKMPITCSKTSITVVNCTIEGSGSGNTVITMNGTSVKYDGDSVSSPDIKTEKTDDNDVRSIEWSNGIKWKTREILTPEDLGVKLPEYNYTDNFALKELKPEDTLKGSELTKINVKEASDDEIKRTFCREV